MICSLRKKTEFTFEGYFTETGLANPVTLVGYQALPICLHVLNTRFTDEYHPAQSCVWVLGLRTQTFMLARQAL